MYNINTLIQESIGHKEDILSVAQCPPNLLATASYDGKVIVWNMVSGHIFCHLTAPPPPGEELGDNNLDQEANAQEAKRKHDDACKLLVLLSIYYVL